MTAAAQPDLFGKPSILRTIVRDADQKLGIYASTDAAAEVRVGDEVCMG